MNNTRRAFVRKGPAAEATESCDDIPGAKCAKTRATCMADTPTTNILVALLTN
jgi:hypothetical protein